MTPNERDPLTAATSGGTHLLREILGMDVFAADGRRLGHVNDPAPSLGSGRPRNHGPAGRGRSPEVAA